MTSIARLQNWSALQPAENAERERLAALQKRPAPNPPALLAMVRVKVLKPFWVRGRTVEIGDVVSLEEHLVRDLEFLKKCERCELK